MPASLKDLFTDKLELSSVTHSDPFPLPPLTWWVWSRGGRGGGGGGGGRGGTGGGSMEP